MYTKFLKYRLCSSDDKSTPSCNLRILLCFTILFLSTILFTGCNKITTTTEEVTQEVEEVIGEITPEDSKYLSALSDEELTKGTISLTPAKCKDYGKVDYCHLITKNQVQVSFSMPEIPKSDDAYIYLFSFPIYSQEQAFNKKPITRTRKSTSVIFDVDFEEGQLFDQYVPAIFFRGKYVPLATGKYITNPEFIAENQTDYPEFTSKKGLLLDPTMLGTEYLTDLGIQHAVYNIPLSIILGETSNPDVPTIEYEYDGVTYYFNGAAMLGYDNLFSYLTENNMVTTAIVLNDWDEDNLDLIHPLAREKTKGAYYYAFNTAEEEGCKHLEAVASFLAERYSDESHGLVNSWVIANEINQRATWNYMKPIEVKSYAEEFEKSLRIFYNAIKSHYASAKVYFSVDHYWNSNDGTEDSYYNAKELLDEINIAACNGGNYDWGLAIHPYPDPLTRVNYWSGTFDKTVNAPIVTIMNLNVITDYLSRSNYLNPDNKVRSITVTELGFSSASGEKLQAAAFAYCYYIIDHNPYIDVFMMNRQTDAKEEVRQGLAFGIYEADSTKKYIYNIFKYIDTNQAYKYTYFMLNILGADSIEEALSWAEK